MSLEPTSVSKPVVRESETVSSNSWNFLQGGRTGTKEGQFNSFWDKAVHGAQKLLGIESKVEEESADEDARADSKSNSASKGTGDPLASTPGFGNGSFGSLAHSVRRDSINSVQFGATDRSFEQSEQVGRDLDATRPDAKENALEPQLTQKEKSEAPQKEDVLAKEKPKSDSEPEAKEELSEEAEDEGEKKQAKTAAPTPQTVLPELQKRPSKETLNSDNQGLKRPLTPLGAEGAENGFQMMSTAAEKVIATEGTAPSQVSATRTGGERTNGSGQRIVAFDQAKLQGEASKLPQQGEQTIAPIAQTTSKSVAAPISESVETSKNQGQQSNKQSPVPILGPNEGAKQAKPEAAPLTSGLEKPIKGAPEKAQEGEILTFDPEKAKAEVSEALKRAPRQARVAQAPVANQSQTQGPLGGNAIAPEAVPNPTTPAKTEGQSEVVEFKNGQNLEAQKAASKTNTGPAKGQVQVGQQILDTNKPNANPQLATASESNAAASSQRAAAHAADSQAAAAARSADARASAASRAKPMTQPAQQALGLANGISGGSLGQTNANPGTQSQSQGQSFENAPKQDAASLMKQNASAAAKADKGSNDGQGFSLQNASETSSRRGQAAEKAAPTTYSSKSAEEVKETFQVLSKGIEKMIASKQNTFTVRINFDQGGSMALKVTMENGQVNSQMQTDLPGLEGMIKQNWSELANDWNAKGVKLNVPQFSTEGGDPRGDSNSSMSFEQQRDARNAAMNGGNGQQGRGGNAQSGNGQGSENDELAHGAQNAESDEVISDTELKTYA